MAFSWFCIHGVSCCQSVDSFHSKTSQEASSSWPHLTCIAFTSDQRGLPAHVLHIKMRFCLHNPQAHCVEKLVWLRQRGSLLKHSGRHGSRSEQNFKLGTSDLKEAAFTPTPWREESFSLLQMQAVEVGHIYKYNSSEEMHRYGKSESSIMSQTCNFLELWFYFFLFWMWIKLTWMQ